MTEKRSNMRLSSIIIVILSVVLVIVSILYSTQRITYSNEKELLNEEIDNTNKELYKLQIESPLRVLLNFLTIRPAKEVDWDEQLIQETHVLFIELDQGISNIATYNLSDIPGEIKTELEDLQLNIGDLLSSLESEEPLAMETKEDIMNFTQSIDACVQFSETQNWERFISDMECLTAK